MSNLLMLNYGLGTGKYLATLSTSNGAIPENFLDIHVRTKVHMLALSLTVTFEGTHALVTSRLQKLQYTQIAHEILAVVAHPGVGWQL